MSMLARIRNAIEPVRGLAKALSLAERVNRINSRWRDNYNPLRGLDARKAVGLFEKAQRGEVTNVEWTFAATWNGIEVTDPTYMALIERCVSPLQEMDWDVLVTTGANGEELSGPDKLLADEQAGVVRAALDRIGNFYQAIEHLAMARFRWFAHLQPINSNGTPTLDAERFEVLNQWNFVRDGSDGDWYWNPDARDTSARSLGDAQRIHLANDLIIYREVPRFVGRVALVKMVRGLLSEKDWDGFIEIFGIPARIIIGPANMSDDQREEFLGASENMKDGSGGVLPNGSTVYSDESIRGLQPFEARLEYLDKRLVLAGTGGMLTMLAEAGSGQLAGGAHSETFRTIARAEARRIGEAIQRQYVDRLLAAKFPGRPKLAYFEIAAKEEQDIGQILEHDAKLAPSGRRIATAYIEEATHYKLEPYQPAALAPGMAMTLNAARPGAPAKELEKANESLVSEAVAQTLGIRADLIKPLFAALDEKAASGAVTDAEFLDAFEALVDQLPELVPADAVERLAAVAQGLLGAGLVNQIAASEETKAGER